MGPRGMGAGYCLLTFHLPRPLLALGQGCDFGF